MATRKKPSTACKCPGNTKPARVERDGYYWKMCRRKAGTRGKHPGTFSKRAACC